MQETIPQNPPLDMVRVTCRCQPLHWYEADHNRVVHEVSAMREKFAEFTLFLSDGMLVWEGQITAAWPGGNSAEECCRLQVRLTYPQGFPVAPIKVLPLSPQIPLRLWGHEWHRWGDGALCLGHPNLWDISYTACDVVEKASEWWFNFLAYLFDHIDEMPDVGRAVLNPQQTSDTTL